MVLETPDTFDLMGLGWLLGASCRFGFCRK